jgi:hypothetical protein
MKGIIPGVGALMTWTIIPSAGVQMFSWLVIILIQEAILVVIPSGGHLGYYSSTGGHFGCYPYVRPDFLFHYRRAIIPGTGAHLCWLVIILSKGGHFDCYPYGRSSWLLS